MSSARSGVLGFTEAELGLFLALLFMGVAAYGAGSSSPPAPAARSLSADSSRLAVVARLAAERDSLARAAAQLGQRAEALGRVEAGLMVRRDSLAALPGATTSAARARRTQLGDSIGRALDSVRVARKATAADQRIAAYRRDSIESRMEPILREEAGIVGVVTAARRQRDSVIRSASAGDSMTLRRYAQLVDSLSIIAGDPERRRALIASASPDRPRRGVEPSPATPARSTQASAPNGRTGGMGRSNQTPSCTELGVAAGDIATVAILDRNRFRVRGQEGSLRTVLDALAAEQRSAERAGCRHVIRVTTVPGLPVELYVPALVDLRRVFNTTLIGPQE